MFNKVKALYLESDNNQCKKSDLFYAFMSLVKAKKHI